MNQTFDIYTRVSDEAGREGESFQSPEDQEAAARAYASAHGWEIGEVIYDGNVSGATAVDLRGLGYLVRRCEAGESAGIICRYVTRFGRDVAEGLKAYKRLDACGARFVATADGLDSANPGAKFTLTMMLAVAEQEWDRNRGNYISGKENAVKRGVYAASAPFGYDRDEGKRLVPNSDADTVREIFRLRAQGVGFSAITRQVGKAASRTGIRRIVMNRAYLGEQRIPDPSRKGEPKVISGNHRPLVTEAEWQAANAVKFPAPARRGLSKDSVLKGLVRCGTCGRAMVIIAYGGGRERRAGQPEKLTFACTNCGSASMAVSKIEPAVWDLYEQAAAAGEPHVVAALESSDRYTAALEAVQAAQLALAEYRDNVSLQQDLGIADFAAGLKVRKAAVETARRALSEVPRPESSGLSELPPIEPLREAYLDYQRRVARMVLAEVLVFPRSAAHRLTLRWQGSEDAVPVPA